MKRFAILMVAWVSTFIGGQALGSNLKPQTYDPYYYCAARYDTCEGTGWAYLNTFQGWCCCDGNGDQHWKQCYGTIEVYTNPPYYTLLCYRLLDGWYETDDDCLPGPVADEPIQEVINEGCGCTMAPRKSAEAATVTSLGSGESK